MIAVYTMNKVIGYLISIAGIVVMAFGFNIIELELAFLDGIASNYIAGVGIVMIVVGVILSLKGSGGRRVRHAKEEVPIYEGTGKNRKIVGYRKD